LTYGVNRTKKGGQQQTTIPVETHKKTDGVGGQTRPRIKKSRGFHRGKSSRGRDQKTAAHSVQNGKIQPPKKPGPPGLGVRFKTRDRSKKEGRKPDQFWERSARFKKDRVYTPPCPMFGRWVRKTQSKREGKKRKKQAVGKPAKKGEVGV